jgi:hypothetical protein
MGIPKPYSSRKKKNLAKRAKERRITFFENIFAGRIDDMLDDDVRKWPAERKTAAENFTERWNLINTAHLPPNDIINNFKWGE